MRLNWYLDNESAAVIGHRFCTSSQIDECLAKVSLKYFKGLRGYGAATKLKNKFYDL